jgi:hypothetical protein
MGVGSGLTSARQVSALDWTRIVDRYDYRLKIRGRMARRRDGVTLAALIGVDGP